MVRGISGQNLNSPRCAGLQDATIRLTETGNAGGRIVDNSGLLAVGVPSDAESDLQQTGRIFSRPEPPPMIAGNTGSIATPGRTTSQVKVAANYSFQVSAIPINDPGDNYTHVLSGHDGHHSSYGNRY
jgi:hypothetical protein